MKTLDAAFELGGGALGGFLDAKQIQHASDAGTAVSQVTYGMAAGGALGAVGFLGRGMVGASIADKALSAGIGMLAFELGRITAARTFTAGTPAATAATQGVFGAGHVGALPPPRATATEQEVRQSIAFLRAA